MALGWGLIQTMTAKEQISCGVVIVAAGRGERAGSLKDGPKQYRAIGGRPIICHTLDVFTTWAKATQIVVVIHPDDEALLDNALKLLPSERCDNSDAWWPHAAAIRAGRLRKLDRAEITHVLIQDARAALHRPCASGSHHRRLRSRCGGGPACRCCRPDTLKRGRSIGSRYGNGAARWPFWRTDAAGLPLLIHPCRPHRRPIVRPDRFHRRRGDRRMGKHAGSADSGPA